MIAKNAPIPTPVRALIAALVVDSAEYPSHPARMVPLNFESLHDSYAFSQILWRHVNTETKCYICRKPFSFERSELHFSLAIDDEGVHFMHKGCAATLNPRAMEVVLEGYQYPDTPHRLEVNWRSPWGARAVIASGLGEDSTPRDLLHAQRQAQALAQLRAMVAELKAELQRRRQARATAAVIQ
jgi:hypothetical protein